MTNTNYETNPGIYETNHKKTKNRGPFSTDPNPQILCSRATFKTTK